MGYEQVYQQALHLKTEHGKEGKLNDCRGRDGKYSKLFRVGPGELGELLDGDPAAAALKAALVDDVGGPLAAHRHYEVRTEVVGGGPKFVKRELREGLGDPRCVCGAVGRLGGDSTGSGAGFLVRVGRRLQEGRVAATHDYGLRATKLRRDSYQ